MNIFLVFSKLFYKIYKISLDSWEMANDGGEQEIDCYECEKSFLLYTNMEITYSTAKKKE
jgi:hypothetical protein